MSNFDLVDLQKTLRTARPDPVLNQGTPVLLDESVPVCAYSNKIWVWLTDSQRSCSYNKLNKQGDNNLLYVCICMYVFIALLFLALHVA